MVALELHLLFQDHPQPMLVVVVALDGAHLTPMERGVLAVVAMV
jgi:hypothetical protein